MLRSRRRPAAPPLLEADDADIVRPGPDGPPEPPCPPAELSHLVRFRLLERVSPELLVRFLKPHEAYLHAHDVHLDGVVIDGAWRSQLHRVLQRVDERMPPTLQQGLIDIANIADQQGHEHALAARHQHQLDLFEQTPARTPIDEAFFLYLEHRPTFRTALARVQASQVERFAEFESATPGARLPLDNARVTRLKASIAGFNAKRNRTAFCDLEIVESEQQVLFVIIHGQPPRSYSVIDTGLQRSRCSFVPDRHDMVIYERATGQLAVSASHPTEQDMYRREFGRIFFGTVTHFAVATYLSCAPLQELGAGALSVAGVTGLRHVRLRQVQVQMPSATAFQHVLIGKDLNGEIDQPEQVRVLRSGEIRSLILDLSLAHQRKLVRLTMTLPNRLVYDRRMGGQSVREFLLARGFVVIPQVARPGWPAPS